MASPKSRKDVEFEYYIRKLAGASIPFNTNDHLDQLKKIWWSHVVSSTNSLEHASDLLYRWLGTLTGVTSKTLPDRWREAVVGIGQTPGASPEENEVIFYTFAP